MSLTLKAITTACTAGLVLHVGLAAPPTIAWKIGTPIATYFAGPPITDATAKQMRAGGFNLVWCHEGELDTAKRHGLRAMLHSELLVPATLDDKAKLAKLDALVDRVKKHPAMYAYFLTDEPSAAQFPGLGKLVAHLREKDPAHLAYINLFPTYASNEQLGVPGGTVAAYKEYLRLFIATVKPDLLSYDHYHFTATGDSNEYFLNIAMIRDAALGAGIPFLNIVQACTWDKGMRSPNADEMRWLNSTSLAYGAQGLSYFVYSYEPFYKEFKEKAGQMMRPDGSTTPLYEAAKAQLPQFVAVAEQLEPLHPLGAYLAGAQAWGADVLPDMAPFGIELPDRGAGAPGQGVLMGLFAKAFRATHAFVVNLDYSRAVKATVVGTGRLEAYDATARKWSAAGGPRATVDLPPGGGVLLRVRK